MKPRIILIGHFNADKVFALGLAGVSRYAQARGWDVETIDWDEARTGSPKALRSTPCPIGFIVEDSDMPPDLPLRLYGLRGGFAAKGGDLTVNLGGEGAKLVSGTDYLPDGTVIQLQSQYADGDLTFANGFDLNGKTQAVNVWSGKTATISGAVSDTAAAGWHLASRNRTLLLKHTQSFVLTIR